MPSAFGGSDISLAARAWFGSTWPMLTQLDPIITRVLLRGKCLLNQFAEEECKTRVEVLVNTLGGAIPIFPVANLEAIVTYYVERLGFHVNWMHGDFFASLSRDRCTLFLSEGDQGHPGTWLWVGTDDADALADELQHRGARIRHPPTNFPWAYEMQVADLDANVLRFGSDPKPEQPYGEFLDMNGRLWPTAGE